ncbi:MAG TPA: TlpA disulfide reductase family protein [Candidatus Methylomirabilis sp.]|nr:TlpA disulfide reductase family protein [Candidatus Methylomirabilis sp.]
MLRLIRYFTVLLCLAPALALAAGPDVVLKDFTGKDRNVNEFVGQGKWTIVTVWSADCPICKRDIFHMTFFHDEHRKKDATVLGLSIDGYANRDKAQGFINDQSLNFPNLIGTPDDPSRLSGTVFIGTPTYYFFSPEGKFMAQRIGPITQAQAEEVIHQLEQDQSTSKKL